jgi:Chaperone of endosialidase
VKEDGMKAFTRKFASEAVAERQGSLLKIRIGCLMLGLLSLVLSASAQVSGSGAHNYVPIWTSAATLGNSTIFETGGKVGIGNTSPGATLDVTGANGGGNGGNAPMALQIKGGSGARGSGIVGGSGAPVNLTAGSGGISTAGGGAGGPMLLTAGSGGLPNGLGGSVVVGAGNGGNGFNSAGVGGIVLFTGGGGGTALLHRAHGGGAGTIQIMGGTGGSFTGKGGNGGSVTLQPGAAGSGPNGTGFPGAVILAPASGKVGIGTSSPTATLDVAAAGTTLADAWTTRSSRRFKTNIRPLEGALDKIEQLQGVAYERKTDGKHEIGVVAEDVYEIVPEVVSRDPENNEVQGVDYSRLAALLIEAVKSQQAEIQHLKAQIEQLKLSAQNSN